MNKIFGLQQLGPVLKKQRTVILTHGAFDLLHVGHLSLLQESRALGGMLIVGLESDEDIMKYKGKKPVLNFNHRMEILSQLPFVDYIVPLSYDEEDVDLYYWKMYFAIRPGVVTFGGNFTFIDEVGVKCKAVNAEAKQIIHQHSDISTTSLIQRVSDQFGNGTLSAYHIKSLLKQ